MKTINKSESSNIDLRVLIEGRGPPVIFIHGWAATHQFWKYQIPYFASSNQVIAYDLRGHGDSEKPQEGYWISDHVSDLEYVLTTLKIRQPVLVGHSLGGMIALQYTLETLEPPRALVMVGTSLRPVASRKRKMQFSLLGWLIRLSRGWASKFTQKEIYAPDVKPELVEWVNNESLRTPRHVILQSLRAVKQFDVMNRLPEIEVPIAFINGEFEKAVEPLERAQIQELLPEAMQLTISDAGHNCMLEQPDRFNIALGTFLQRLKEE